MWPRVLADVSHLEQVSAVAPSRIDRTDAQEATLEVELFGIGKPATVRGKARQEVRVGITQDVGPPATGPVWPYRGHSQVVAVHDPPWHTSGSLGTDQRSPGRDDCEHRESHAGGGPHQHEANGGVRPDALAARLALRAWRCHRMHLTRLI